MTTKEAAKILGQYDVSCIQFYWTEGEPIPADQTMDALEMAIEALGKQTPMSPGMKELGITGKACTPCGYCGEGIDPMWDYCPWCGQKIRRSS